MYRGVDRRRLTASGLAIRQSDLPLQPTLDDRNLTREDHEPEQLARYLPDKILQTPSNSLSHFSLNIQRSAHRHDEEVAIIVRECLLAHVRVARIGVHHDALAQYGTAVASHRLDAIDKVDRLDRRRNVGVPDHSRRCDALLRVVEGEVSDEL